PTYYLPSRPTCRLFFLFNAPPSTQISPLSLHDALPISINLRWPAWLVLALIQLHALSSSPTFSLSSAIILARLADSKKQFGPVRDRKSTRLNSSHVEISYAVFCLKKKLPSASPTSFTSA